MLVDLPPRVAVPLAPDMLAVVAAGEAHVAELAALVESISARLGPQLAALVADLEATVSTDGLPRQP